MMKTPKSICRFKKKFFSLEPQISSFSLKFPLTIEQGLGLFQSSWKCSGLEGKFCFFLPERPILQLAVAEGKQKSSQQANLPPDKYFSLGKQSVERLSRAVQPSGGQLHHIHEPDVLHWLQKKKKKAWRGMAVSWFLLGNGGEQRSEDSISSAPKDKKKEARFTLGASRGGQGTCIRILSRKKALNKKHLYIPTRVATQKANIQQQQTLSEQQVWVGMCKRNRNEGLPRELKNKTIF